MLFAFAVGYILGARAGKEGLDEVAESMRALRESEEFAALVSAARSYLSHTLHEAGALVAPDSHQPLTASELLSRLRGSPSPDTTRR